MKTKMLSLTLVFGIFLFAIFNVYPQATLDWASRFHNSVNGSGQLDMKVDGLGNVYIAGNCDSTNSEFRMFIVQYDLNGNLRWSRIFYDTNYTMSGALALQVDNQNKVYVAGFVADSLHYNHIITQKYDEQGNLLWSDIYGESPASNTPSALTIDPEGSVYICGRSTKNSGSLSDLITIKYNAQGQRIWVILYNGPANRVDYANNITSDKNGFIYVTGTCTRNTNLYDFVTIKYDKDGNSKWTSFSTIPGTFGRHAYFIKIDTLSNVYVGGSRMVDTYWPDYLTIKYDSAGNQLWWKIYSGSWGGEQNISGLELDDSGNVYVSGYSRLNNYAYESATIKYNTSGIQQWVNEYYSGNGFNGTFGNSLVLDKQRNVYVVGYSYTDTVRQNDYILIKYNTYGQQQWIITYNSPYSRSDEASKICIDDNSNIYISGDSYNSTTGSYDFATLKYSQTIGIKPISTEIPKDFSLSQNYPNPFNPSTKIKFAVPKNGDVRIIIYDAIGREVATLVNEPLNPGSYEVEWNATNFPSGVYFYKMYSGSFSATKKLVLVK